MKVKLMVSGIQRNIQLITEKKSDERRKQKPFNPYLKLAYQGQEDSSLWHSLHLYAHQTSVMEPDWKQGDLPG